MPTRTVSSKPCEQGFVLVTSLVFLVVVTLLAVTAINSSTLQERMASNQRDKSQARQASDTGLRAAETALLAPIFNRYQPAGQVYGNNLIGNSGLPIARPGTVFNNAADPTGADAGVFLEARPWQQNGAWVVNIEPAGNAQSQAGFTVETVIEEVDFEPNTLDPNASAQAEGTAIYRITARAAGANPAARSVTQSFFTKDY